MSRAAPWMALAMLLLAGCASIPLATLWQLRGFGPDDVAAIDPAQLRVAERIEPGAIRVDPARTRLVLELTPRQGDVERYRFTLRHSAHHGAALAPPDWQVMELDDAGRARMRLLQPRLAKAKALYKAFSLSVESKFVDEPPAGIDVLRMSTRVQLADTQSPLTLLDRMPLVIERN